ncbi:hypothetical protein AZOA_17890 [Azoarcus sp. Aa7]|nr:hypothetical protein [Azoarcus sp. Aa7]
MSERLAEQRIQCEMLSESVATTRAGSVLEQQRRIAAETKLDTVTRLFEQLVQYVPVRGEHSSEHDCGKQSRDATEPAS